MKFGEKYEITLVNSISGKTFNSTTTYKRTSWNEWHTNDEGCGLWCDDKQILGTCQFSVTGCETEKAAKAKIRNWVNENR